MQHPELSNQTARHPNEELKPTQLILKWLRPTKWRILWLIGVPGFIWWTASIYLGHEVSLFFSPQTLTVTRQTRINLPGTNIPLFTSDKETDDRFFLLSDFLVIQEIWTPTSENIEWWLIYKDDRPSGHSWLIEEFAKDYGIWLGWTNLEQGPWDTNEETPKEFWDTILLLTHTEKNPDDDSIREILLRKRAEFSEQSIGSYEEAAMEVDVVYYVKRNRPLTKLR